ncbi:hypothetical protein N7520_006939 [Penicillium odoratum]|uniref:uncharacterized protein n=1 Tax=Penicillium odoratum TaxID=1167516 RepID=UPI002548D67F|nr:uncharacterized protein N7520_006939 [Penicillium odoratum]KAJ5759783.1 hypothetical protein N7520_006939 [Penicillium odoratum]
MNSETSQSPNMTFSVLGPAAPVLAPRAGTLAIAGRKTLSTPHYLPVTSRGVVPHISQDNVRKETAINGLYVGLEDFIEKKHRSPVYKIPVEANESPLRKFICASSDLPLVLGPRRFPALPCPPVNTETSIAISTSDGFHQLSGEQYIEATMKLKPDLVIGLADMVTGKPPGNKRRGKMVDRTHAYTRDALDRLYGHAVAVDKKCKSAYFAPVLPLENAQQSLYLDDLANDFRDRLSGLALYESASLTFIPESLGSLPRLLLSDPRGPHAVLRAVMLGADLLTIPFVGESSDAGIALDFTFPAPPKETDDKEPLALGIDMWSSEYAKDTFPLREGCQCYACRHHHRAYFNHLLAAKEMAAWALLQMHNFHTMDLFFHGVRESIQRGSFEQDVEAFSRIYASTLPESTGQGPRLRAYQHPGANQPTRAPRVYGRLEDALQKFQDSQSSVVTPDTDAEGLEKHGFAEKT